MCCRPTRCAVKRWWSTAGVYPPGNWFAPPGSNRSSGRGNEAAEAFGAEGRIGDLASMQAITSVNAEQASKSVMQEPTRPGSREGRSEWNCTSEQIPFDLPGSTVSLPSIPFLNQRTRFCRLARQAKVSFAVARIVFRFSSRPLPSTSKWMPPVEDSCAGMSPLLQSLAEKRMDLQ